VNIVCQLVESNVTYCQFLRTITFFNGRALNIPDAYDCLIFFNFDFALLVNTFEQTALPPPNILPNLMIFNKLLNILFFALLIFEIVSQRKYHKLF